MFEYNFQCPVCCKHIVIKKADWIKGGIVRCESCGNAMRMKPHPEKSVVTSKQSRKRK